MCEFNATAVLFVVLSIGTSFHCNTTGCAGCVWLWQVGFRRVQFSPGCVAAGVTGNSQLRKEKNRSPGPSCM